MVDITHAPGPFAKAARTLPTAMELKLRREQRRGAAVRYTVLIALGLIMLYPLICLVGASFKTNSEIFASPWFWPMEPTVQGYIDGWRTSTPYTFGHFFLNTLWIVIPKMLGTAISSVIVAYGFARFDFPGKKVLFGILIATLLLPDVVRAFRSTCCSATSAGSTPTCRCSCRSGSRLRRSSSSC